MGVATELFRYPVKSMRGERVEHLEFSESSATGDRRWALFEPGTGVFLSAKRNGILLEASARTQGNGSVVITLPDGAELAAGEATTNDRLSDWLGRRVELRRPSSETSPAYEALGDALDEASETQLFSGPTSHFADFADVHVLTTASLRAAGGLHPASDWDVRRFRPTILVDTGETEVGFVEDDWIGSRLVIGSAGFDVFMKTPRCNLPTRAQPGLERDTAVARVLRDEHEFCLGVYAAFRQPGIVTAGDPVRLETI